ncbi:MAG: hypothetical protein JNK29_04735 [Anaerolineales bacterium]|nr:hypothetical protein [Anaerolineales bacterium]
MSDVADYSRRIFLRALGLGAAGLVVGGGAAWAQGQLADQAALQGSVQTLEAQLAAAQKTRLGLDGSLAALQGQVTTLEAQLGAATGQNAQLAQALTQSQSEAEALRGELAALQSRLAETERRLGEHRELIGLFDQLESVGLDAVAADGLRSAAAGLAAALGASPVLRAGLDTARRLLAEFEQVLPDFQAGLGWLGDQVIRLKLELYALERAAQPLVAAAAAGATAVFGGFVRVVLDYLPFDIGAKTRAAFEAAQAVITRASDVSGQTDERVFGKLSRYVSGGQQSWQQQLVPPLRDQTLASAEHLLTAVDGAQQTFEAALRGPAQAALDQRAALRQQIAAYRAARQL